MFTAKPQTRCNKPNASQVCKPRLNCRKALGQVWKKPWARFPVSFEATFLKRLLIRILVFPQATLQASFTSQDLSSPLPNPKPAWDGAVVMSRGKFQLCLAPSPMQDWCAGEGALGLAGSAGRAEWQAASPIDCSGFIFIGFQYLAFWAEFHAKSSNPRGLQALWTCKTTNVTKIGLKLI